MNKSILILPVAALLLTLSTGSALAAGSTYSVSTGSAYGATGCQPIYGGGESCAQAGQIVINKQVQNPQTKIYVDNLGINDAKYGAGQNVTFKLTVTNTSSSNLKNIVLKDVLPEFVTFVSAPGKFDQNTKTLTLNIDTLNANEARDFFVVTKVAGKDNLPKDQDIMCLVNQATISMDSKVSQDNAQFCIEKAPAANPTTTKGGLKVFPPAQATTTPETGPEALALFGLIPSAIGGVFLRRKSK